MITTHCIDCDQTHGIGRCPECRACDYQTECWNCGRTGECWNCGNDGDACNVCGQAA